MDPEVVGVALFLACIVATIKIIVDGRFRSKLINAQGSSEMVRAFLDAEQAQRRFDSLRWGLVLATLAIGFGVIEAIGWRGPTPGVFAVLLGAAAIGNLAFFFTSRGPPPQD